MAPESMRSAPHPRPPPAASLLLVCALLTGCATHTAARMPVPLEGLSFSTSGAAPVAEDWWAAFEAPELDALVRSALDSNFTVRAAFARLEAARALTQRTRAPLFPSVAAEAGANLSTDGPLMAGTRSPARIGLTASWEVDLWGRVRAQVGAQGERTAASLEDARAAALSLPAEVVGTWVAIGATRQELALLDAQLQTNRDLVEAIAARVVNGIQGPADLLRQERLLEQTHADRLARQAELELLEHRLPVLLGRPPRQRVRPLPDALPALPPLPDAGIPAELLRRRPDVRSAEHALRAADEDVVAAIADQFPKLSLNAGAFGIPESPAAPLQGFVASLGASLLANLVQGGERKAEIRRTRALVEESIARYGEVVLRSLQEVEDALALDRNQEAIVSNVDRQVDLAERAVESLTVRYTGGIDVGFLDLVTAQAAAQQLRREQIAVRREHLGTRIGLYRALAGGLEPTEAQP